MSEPDFKQSPIILLGVGGAGGAIATGVCRAYSGAMRMLVLDTDARSQSGSGVPFQLLGGNRLSGVGAGGSVADARSAVRDELDLVDARLVGVRTAVIVTGLGGGTGGGVAVEVVQHLRQRGIVTLLFATLPFAFEGAEVRKRAMSVRSVLEDAADVAVFIELDELVTSTGTDNMKEAMQRGTDTLASGVTLLWRLLEKPGYIRLSPEDLRKKLVDGGPARFVTATAAGEGRTESIVAAIKASPLLGGKDIPRTRALLLGILAGDDLRLSEVGAIVNDLKFTFAPNSDLAVGTVNDEDTFSGRIAVVALIFGQGARTATARRDAGPTRRVGGISNGPQGLGRFNNTVKTTWQGEDLDIPTFLRQNITLDR